MIRSAAEWRYATVDDGQIDLESGDYLVIGTLESYEKMRTFYGRDALIPLYIEVEDGERLERALKENGARRNRNMQRCAGGFLQTPEIFLRKTWRGSGYGNGL